MKTKAPEWIRISKYCVNKGCQRRAVLARRMSDFWVAVCEECNGKKITLDMNKIPSQKPEGWTPGKKAA